MLTDADKRSCEELYELATNASNLRHQAGVRTATDVLRDMAMSANVVGAAAKRLRAQWASAERPVRRQPRTAKQFAALLPHLNDGLAGRVPDAERARMAHERERAELDAWYFADMERLLARLVDLPQVREALTWQAIKWGMDQPEEKAARVVRYWLDQTCHQCCGRKFQHIPGTPALSAKPCRACGASGLAPVPFGQEGRRLANHIDQCVHRYDQRRARARKELAALPPIDRLSKRWLHPQKGCA